MVSISGPIDELVWTQLLAWLASENATSHARKALFKELGILVGEVLGVGGISVCFEARPCEDSSGIPKLLAVKVSHKADSKDFVAGMAQGELVVIESLHQSNRQGQGVPELFCSGSLSIGDTTHHFMVMQRLGNNLDALSRCREITSDNFVQYALGMLEAVETVHKAGWVHLDIKPGNFCTSYCSSISDEVYIIDFGTALRGPAAGQTDRAYAFFGTVDYSSTRALLQHTRPGPADDIESLCYSYLQMWNGRLPWSLADQFTMEEEGCWQDGDVREMLKIRTSKWKKVCSDVFIIPPFLQKLHNYALSLKTHEMPDYDYMRHLVTTAHEKPERLPTMEVTKRNASMQAVEGPRKRLHLSSPPGTSLLQPEE
ncbi:probable casein kinase I isoform delta [Coccomyxa sp. Obi]|nr:probable casein kinase I isoform delta [Coccomyxa sp. Obi]